MLTPIRPQTPQFAGKPKKTNTKKKAGLLGLLLASAGGASALPANNNGIALKGSHNNTASDSFAYIPQAAASEEEKPGGLHKLLKRQSQLPDYTSFDDAPPLYLEDDAEDVKAREILKKPAFKPTDINLFNPSIYPEAKPMKLAPVTEVNEDELKASLLETLTKRFKGDADKAKKAMEVFDDKDLKEIMPDPKSRAVLVNQRGTIGRSAIDVITNGTYSHVAFKQLYPSKTGLYDIDPEKAIAVMYPGPMNMTFNSRYQGEPAEALSAIIPHESLHQDNRVYKPEELTGDVLVALVYAQQLLENPKLAEMDTELIRRLNTLLLTLLNSRDEEGNLRLFMPDGSNTVPGSGTTIKDLAAYHDISNPRNARPSSPGNAHLRAMLKAVTGQDVADPDFDVKTVTLLDKNLKCLKPTQLVELAKILKLDIGEEGTKGTGNNTTDDPNNEGPESCGFDCGENSGAHSSASVPKKMLLGLGLGVPAARAFGLF